LKLVSLVDLKLKHAHLFINLEGFGRLTANLTSVGHQDLTEGVDDRVPTVTMLALEPRAARCWPGTTAEDIWVSPRQLLFERSFHCKPSRFRYRRNPTGPG
jgi:hypothetical protein